MASTTVVYEADIFTEGIVRKQHQEHFDALREIICQHDIRIFVR